MNVSTNVIPVESHTRLERVPSLVARNRRCGPEARRRRALLFVVGLVVLSAVLTLADRRANERATSPPAPALIGSL
jgi:hypothetical protein